MAKDKVGKSDREAKRCTACGARMWLKDYTTGQWSGPWHFQDCPSIPGGAELCVQNIEARAAWEKEKYVPKEQAWRILDAIMLMLDSPTHEIMMQRKAAIQAEIKNLKIVCCKCKAEMVIPIGDKNPPEECFLCKTKLPWQEINRTIKGIATTVQASNDNGVFEVFIETEETDSE